MSVPKSQMSLLEVPVFAAGPARAPRGRAKQKIAVSSLDLPFKRPVEIETLGKGYQNAVGQRIKKAPVPESVGPPESRVLVGGRLRGPRERAQLEEAFEATLGEFRRRRQTLYLKQDSDWLELDVNAEFVRAHFSGKAAVALWFPAIRRVGSEYGLVEMD